MDTIKGLFSLAVVVGFLWFCFAPLEANLIALRNNTATFVLGIDTAQCELPDQLAYTLHQMVEEGEDMQDIELTVERTRRSNQYVYNGISQSGNEIPLKTPPYHFMWSDDCCEHHMVPAVVPYWE